MSTKKPKSKSPWMSDFTISPRTSEADKARIESIAAQRDRINKQIKRGRT